MDDAETGRSGRERSRDRSQTREDPQEPRLSGGGLEDGRLSRLETQVSELSQAMLALGPAVQQILQLQRAQQVNPNMPTQRPEPPTAAPPPPFNPGSFPQTPGSADVSNAQPSQANNPNVIDPNVVNASGSQPILGGIFIKLLPKPLGFLISRFLPACLRAQRDQIRFMFFPIKAVCPRLRFHQG